MADKDEEKKEAAEEPTLTKREEKDLRKLADSPSPADERAAQGDWAKSNNPSPEEQAAEQARSDAQKQVAELDEA